MPELPVSQFSALPNGRQLAWREWGAGKPLIMLHGWSMSSVVFSEVARSLAADFRVLCPDLPGHGQSVQFPAGSLAELAEAVEQWAAQLGIQSAFMLGWSLGGQVALKIAADDRLPVSKLLLVSTTPRFCQTTDWVHGLPETQVRSLDRNLGRAFEKTMGDFFNLQFANENLSKDRYRQILNFAVRTGQLPQSASVRATLQVLSQVDLRPLLSHIEQPTLVVHGEIDQIIPVSAGEYLSIQLPQAQLYRLTGIGHAPFFSCPEECLTQWRRFLQ